MLVPPAILLLEYKSKAEMAHIPQSQDDHQMTMEDSEHNFQNIAEDIQMVRLAKMFWLDVFFFLSSCFVSFFSFENMVKYDISFTLKSSDSPALKWIILKAISKFITAIFK